ncbi:hypothetical protein ACCO45_006565 [Purpureocillium lilacinum]|uniref:Uncharacterized protein n=1 Tax=Purpureocillium lilacinum TaxID=33203 RepID=A0ACC4DSZ1_PURLI
MLLLVRLLVADSEAAEGGGVRVRKHGDRVTQAQITHFLVSSLLVTDGHCHGRACTPSRFPNEATSAGGVLSTNTLLQCNREAVRPQGNDNDNQGTQQPVPVTRDPETLSAPRRRRAAGNDGRAQRRRRRLCHPACLPAATVRKPPPEVMMNLRISPSSTNVSGGTQAQGIRLLQAGQGRTGCRPSGVREERFARRADGWRRRGLAALCLGRPPGGAVRPAESPASAPEICGRPGVPNRVVGTRWFIRTPAREPGASVRRLR